MGRQMNFSRALLVTGVSSLAWIGATEPASAASATGATVQELIVTAQKREQSIQSVPSSVAAVSGAELQGQGSKTFIDFATRVPGVSFLDSGGGGSRPILRGVSSFLGSPTVAIYLDDAPIQVRSQFEGSGGSSDIRLIDVERIEVLRGPQGTLYGGGSMGGAIKYVMREPNLAESEGRLRVETASTAHGSASYEGAFAGSIPVIQDRLAIRASVVYRQDGGYVDNYNRANPPQRIAQDIDKFDTFGLRLAVKFKPTDWLEATPSYFYQRVAGGGLSTFNSGLGPLRQNTLFDETSRDRLRLTSLPIKAELGPVELTSITSYLDRAYQRVEDYSLLFGDPPPPFPAAFGPYRNNALQRQNVLTQEVRLQSNDADARFGWLVGGFYYLSQLRGQQPVEGLNAPSIFFSADNRYRDIQLAAFGEIYIQPIDHLRVTLGVRYTDISTRFMRVSSGLAAGNPPPPPLNQVRSEKPIAPKLNVSYEFSKDNLVYLQAARGYRTGQASAVLPNTCSAELASRGLTPTNGIDSDNLWTYEGGTKLTSEDRRSRLAASAYLTKWTAKPETLPLRSCGFSILANVGEAEIKGLEFEGQTMLGPNVRLSGSLGYTDAVYTKTDPVLGFASGDPLPLVPKWTASLGAEYTFTLGSWDGFARADYVYRDRMALGSVQPGFFTVIHPYSDRYSFINTRIGLDNGRWNVAAFLNNIFDNDPVVYATSLTPRTRTQDRITTLRPRTLGVALGVNF